MGSANTIAPMVGQKEQHLEQADRSSSVKPASTQAGFECKAPTFAKGPDRHGYGFKARTSSSHVGRQSSGDWRSRTATRPRSLPFRSCLNDGHELVLSFDTTPEMWPFFVTMRELLCKSLGSLKAKYPNLRVGIIAHGDYCDKQSSYVIRFLPLTSDFAKLKSFLANVKPTRGGDESQCYELALGKTSFSMGWQASPLNRTLLLVGDVTPHEPGYTINGYTNNIDWREMLQKLAHQSVRCVAVQCGGETSPSAEATSFFQTCAGVTRGVHVHVSKDAAGHLKLTNLTAALCTRTTEDLEVCLEDASLGFAPIPATKRRYSAPTPPVRRHACRKAPPSQEFVAQDDVVQQTTTSTTEVVDVCETSKEVTRKTTITTTTTTTTIKPPRVSSSSWRRCGARSSSSSPGGWRRNMHV